MDRSSTSQPTVNKWCAVLTVCRFQINCMAAVVCLLRPRQHEVRPAGASCLKVIWQWSDFLTNLLLTVLWCAFFPPHRIRIWKKVGTACPSQPITCCPRQPPVWETSPHWTSPTMRNCPQTPATPLTRKKRVSIVWVFVQTTTKTQIRLPIC